MWKETNVADDSLQTPSCAQDQPLAWNPLSQRGNRSSSSAWSKQTRSPRSLWYLETASTLIVLCEIKPVGVAIAALHRYLLKGDCSPLGSLGCPVKPVWVLLLAKATGAETTEISWICSGVRMPSLKAGRGAEILPISLGSFLRIAWSV